MTSSAFQKFFSAKLILLLLLVGVVVLGSIQYRQRTQRQGITGEIGQLQQQQRGLEQKNQELSDSLQYLTSAGYKDRIARQQLGLKKNGEVVYGFAAGTGDTAVVAPTNKAPSASHLEAWWLYLFHNAN